MKGKNSKKWIIVTVAVVLVAAVAFGLLRPKMSPPSGQLYKAVQVTKGDMQVTVHGSGSLEPIKTQTVHSETAGRIESILVENGDTVVRGQPLIMLDGDALNTTIDGLKEQIVAQDNTIATLRNMAGSKTLTTPVESRVKAIYTEEGEDVNRAMSTDNALMLLSADGMMKVAFVPETGAELTPGQPIMLRVGDKEIEGFLTEIPDGTTDRAQALVEDDSFALGEAASVYSTDDVLLGKGELELNRPLRVTAYSGKVEDIYVDVGDIVKANRKLLKLEDAALNPDFEAQLVKRQQLQDDLDKAYEDRSKLVVAAPYDGIVSDLVATEGSTIPDGTALCTIQNVSSYKLVVAVDELDIPGIKVGQTATVSIDALPNETATAVVVRSSQLGTKANDITTYDVTLEVNAPAGTLANMTASTDILVQESKNTLLVPVEAIVNRQGKSYINSALATDIRANQNGSKPISDTDQQRIEYEVQVGLVNDSYAQILSGLNEGDTIAVPLSTGMDMREFFAGMNGRNGQGGAVPQAPNNGR